MQTSDTPGPLGRVLREPLVWFLALGALLFALQRPGSEVTAADARIVVTAGRVEQMATIFARTWMRPPTAEELRGLIRAHVLEELKARQAIAMGLERDDTVIRRRLAQKWDFLTEDDGDLLTPSDADLAAYLAEHPERFRVDARTTFRQLLVGPDRHGERAEAVAEERLAALRAGAEVEGDPTLLPGRLEDAAARELESQFGPGFAAALEGVPLGEWGRVESSFGLHLVRVDARDPGRLPALDDVRALVAREWADAERRARAERREEELLASAQVVIEWPEGAEAAAAEVAE